MAKEKQKTTQVVLLRPILHAGEHQAPGTKLTLELTLGNRLIYSKKAMPINTKAENEEANIRLKPLLAELKKHEAEREVRRNAPTYAQVVETLAEMQAKIDKLEAGKK